MSWWLRTAAKCRRTDEKADIAALRRASAIDQTRAKGTCDDGDRAAATFLFALAQRMRGRLSRSVDTHTLEFMACQSIKLVGCIDGDLYIHHKLHSSRSDPQICAGVPGCEATCVCVMRAAGRQAGGRQTGDSRRTSAPIGVAGGSGLHFGGPAKRRGRGAAGSEAAIGRVCMADLWMHACRLSGEANANFYFGASIPRRYAGPPAGREL